MNPPFSALVSTVLLLVTTGCGDDPPPSSADGTGTGDDVMRLTAEEVAPVAAAYADLVLATYDDALTEAQGLDAAVLALTADPTVQTQEAAKAAWLAARLPYGRSESFRFYDGPIDHPQGPEGRLNAWPMDEAYVDYVEGMPDAGIINDPTIDITAQALAELNEQGGEENVATGYHAIEFLLWGQDLDDGGPGTRSFEDFVDAGPMSNPERRRLYLETVSSMLVADLEGVRAEWVDRSDAYRTQFLALPPEQIVQNIMRGIGTLAAAELSEERMNVAYDTKLQEDEHSCFSDNTHNDILYNFQSIANVYRGDYGGMQGLGIDSLVQARDPALAQAIEDKLIEAETNIQAIPVPFDQAIVGEDASLGRAAIAAAITSLRDLGDLLVEAATSMGLTLNTALE